MKTFGIAAATVSAAATIAVALSGTANAAALTKEVKAEFNATAKVVDKFWATHYREYFGGTYTSPNFRGLVYQTVNTGCGEMKTNNAFYCPADDSVTFGAPFIGEASKLGDLWIYDVVAHEWGHAIQTRAGLPMNELAAECLAGATLGEMAAEGTVVVEDGDEDELVRLDQFAGDAHSAQSNSDHGTAQEQHDSFMKGWNGGVNACI
ncbi:MAG: neutral zinc metallopeptidase [Nocardiaceae bacterium]|nr:neutral zinc metallopeptidase [Nocardiaceae bacterium]